MSRRVTVHHFVANVTTRQYGSHPTSDLLGVDYWRDVPADTEFPRLIGNIDLFTRFHLQAADPMEFYIRLWWLDERGRDKELVGHYGPYKVNFRPDEFVHDHAFRTVHLQVKGVGFHAFRLLRRRRTWKGWRFGQLAETHFRVER